MSEDTIQTPPPVSSAISEDTIQTPPPVSSSVSEDTIQTPPPVSGTGVRMADSAGQKFDFYQLYKKGIVYVFPLVFDTKFKAVKTKEPIPQDPAEKQLPPHLSKIQEVTAECLEKQEHTIRGENAEAWVIELLQNVFQSTMQSTDAPCFVLHNVELNPAQKKAAKRPQSAAPASGASASSGSSQSEIDTICLHRKLGVVVVEVKAVKNKPARRLKEAVIQVLEKKRQAEDFMQGLGTTTCVKTLLVLPDADPKYLKDAKQNIQILCDNPDVELIVGRRTQDFQDWLTKVTSALDPVWEGGSPDEVYTQVASRYLSVVRVREPDDVVGQVAEQHRSWLLTEEQMAVRDSTEKLLHIHGPPGAGKTLILLHRARRWLCEGKSVILACGSYQYDVLKSHLGRALLRGQGEASSRLCVCSYSSDIETAVKEWVGRDLCIVTDELHDDTVFTAMVEGVREGRVQSCWSADVEDVTAKSDRARQLGWKAARLEGSIRCPQHVVDLLNSVVAGSTRHSAIKVCSVPRPRLLSRPVTVIDHSVHQHCVPRPPLTDTDTWPWLYRELQCGQCRQQLSEAMQCQHPDTDTDKDTERWRQWVVIHTGEDDDTTLDDTAAALRHLHIPCVCEPPALSLRDDVTVSSLVPIPRDPQSAVTSPYSSLSDADEKENAAWRERVVSGLDEEGRPAVHVVSTAQFRGLEKPRVLLCHCDKADFLPSLQSQDARTARLELHREQWFQAASRCQGQLVLLLLSPSPARSLLPQPPSPVFWSSP